MPVRPQAQEIPPLAATGQGRRIGHARLRQQACHRQRRKVFITPQFVEFHAAPDGIDSRLQRLLFFLLLQPGYGNSLI